MTTLQHSPVAAYQRSLLSRPSTKPFSSSPPPLAPPPPSSSSSSAVRFSSLRLLLPSFSTRVVLDSRARRGGCGPLRAARGDSAAASYATSLLQLAESGNSLDATCEDIGKVETIFSVEEVFDLVAILDAEQKLEFIDEIGTSTGLQKQTVDFLKGLIDADRIDIVLDVVKEFKQLYDDLTGTEVAVVDQ
ncbi:hypothetical protein Droror1_Dr00003524 [Drosera rotundifolia]